MCGVFAHRCAILAPGQKPQTPEQFVPERLIMMSGWDWRMFGMQRSVGGADAMWRMSTDTSREDTATSRPDRRERLTALGNRCYVWAKPVLGYVNRGILS